MSRIILPTPPVIPNIAHPQLRGCVAWWPCLDGSGTSVAEVINKQNGTFGATTTAPTWGRHARSRAISFDGGDVVNCGSSTLFDALGAFTLSAWIRPASLSAVGTIFAADEASGTTPPIVFRIINTSGFINLFTDTSAGTGNLNGTSQAVAAGETAHVVGRYNGATLSVFVNGKQDATTAAVTGTTDAVDGTVRLGAWASSGSLSQQFNGQIGNVRVYDRALTAAEIRDLYLNPWAPTHKLRPVPSPWRS